MKQRIEQKNAKNAWHKQEDFFVFYHIRGAQSLCVYLIVSFGTLTASHQENEKSENFHPTSLAAKHIYENYA